ncbi:MAG: hypothetical protein CMO55_23340 [Verrucomicrobiales bacterium]|nr:hypothetical protein [Verrucomicrobiales bacterium]
MDDRTKFIKWYVRPFNRLKRIKNGDGAFIILSTGIFLCERYYRIKSNCIRKDDLPDKFYKVAAKDLKVDLDVFERFWGIFRHGMQHRGQPQKWFKEWTRTRSRKTPKRYGWSIDNDYSAVPTMCKINGKKTICINPHKFTHLMLCKFLQRPDYLGKSVRHQFGNISPRPTDCICE